jgi:glutaredoxin
MLRIALLFIFVATAASAAGQSLYRWKDGAGQVHYTSDPPPGVAAGKVRARVNSYSAPAKIEAAPASAAAAPAGPVVMYATSWCPYCAKARAYFARKGIAYAEYDVEKSATANAEFRRLGGRGVPLILVGREKMSGFSEPGFDALLARAAR